jgi:subtilisin-like proprotein convertase family protein
MESLFNTLRLCLAVLIVSAAGMANAQTMTGVDPGPYVSPDKYIGQQEESVQHPDAPVSQEPIAQTDEYGSFNFNAYLTGLGASGGYMAVPNFPNENVNGSVEAWVYPTATTSSAPCIVGKGDATNVGFLFGWVASSTKLYMRFGNTPVTNTAGTNVPLNTWTHVAATWTGGAGNFTVQFYVNGAPSGAAVNNAGTWNITSDSLTVGSIRAPFGGKNFYGFIDEVRMWTDLRTSTEIRDNRFVGLGDATGANTSSALTSSSHYAGLTSSWNFNQGGTSMSDFIGGRTGYLRSASTVYSAYAPQPIPYNFAGLFPDGTNDYIVIPDNAVFDQTAAGSMEAWIYLNAAGQLNTIFQKGASFAATTLAFYVTATNKIGINIGAHNYISTGPTTFVANRWYHVAATWTGGPNFTVRLYVNGVQDYTATFNLAMPTNADPAWIGRYYTTTGNFNGYIDEVRLWGNALTADQIKQNMFASGRTLLPNANLVGLWMFDGNILNYSATAGINGSYNSGGTNNCRLSAFRNETSTGALSTSFVAHATTVNRLLSAGPFPFPQGFIVKAPNKPILDNTTIRDTITVSGSAALTAINVFLAVRHTFAADLDVTLRAPNGQTRDLTSDNGGTGEDVLTFFVDGSQTVTNAAFYPPWSNVAGPEVTMGNFGGTNIQGNWILEIADDAGGDTGSLIGWGLRFNNAITNIEPVSNITPGTFKLYQNYPNPFNPVTNIRFDLPKASNVKLVVYDILGREVRTLLNDFQNPGSYEINFDAANFASGTYFYRIEAGDFVEIKKMVLVK